MTGRIWTFGDNVNSDVIFPGKYTYTLKEPSEIAAHALEDLQPDFAAKVQPQDIIVAGVNWGCGSSREQAVTCLVYAGVSAIVARSFSRIYYRNALNNGLLAIECPEFVDLARPAQVATVSLKDSTISLDDQGISVGFKPFSPVVIQILEVGGLVSFVKQQLKRNN